MKDILVEIFECGCCRFAEPLVRNVIGRRSDRVECRYYTLPRDRAVFEAHRVASADTALQSPVVIVSNRTGEQIRVDKINQQSVQDALERLLAN